MSGTNHIIGGTVVTGIYLSIFDINIFASPYLLFFTAFFAIIPDVDHTKSLIGKIFYPAAKYIYIKFGHRTITHSLLAYFIGLVLLIFIEQVSGTIFKISSVFACAFASHLIFDMITKQGVPLAYPFRKNPCVIPGNPAYRINSGSLKAEAMAFILFTCLGLSARPLYKQGFWNSFNRTFSNIAHIRAEMLLSNNAINVDYQFINESNQEITGSGIAVSNDGNTLVIASEKSFVTIRKEFNIKAIKPTRTNQKIQVTEQNFSGLTFGQFMQLIQNKHIKQLNILSNLPVNFVSNNRPNSSTAVNLEYVFNPVLVCDKIDSTDINFEKQLKQIEYQIANEQIEEQKIQAEKIKITAKYTQVKHDLESTDFATKERAVNDWPKAKSDYENLSPIPNKISPLLIQKNYLQTHVHISKEPRISGYISFLTIQ